jgi:hypothetical protein
MSDLRNQLHKAKDEYRSLHYPGDSSNEILRRKNHRWLWPLVAAAAAVLMLITLRIEHVPQTHRQLSSITSTTKKSPASDLYWVSPQPPADMSLTPPACELDFTPPSLSLSADVQNQSSTTKESV